MKELAFLLGVIAAAGTFLYWFVESGTIKYLN